MPHIQVDLNRTSLSELAASSRNRAANTPSHSDEFARMLDNDTGADAATTEPSSTFGGSHATNATSTSRRSDNVRSASETGRDSAPSHDDPYDDTATPRSRDTTDSSAGTEASPQSRSAAGESDDRTTDDSTAPGDRDETAATDTTDGSQDTTSPVATAVVIAVAASSEASGAQSGDGAEGDAVLELNSATTTARGSATEGDAPSTPAAARSPAAALMQAAAARDAKAKSGAGKSTDDPIVAAADDATGETEADAGAAGDTSATNATAGATDGNAEDTDALSDTAKDPKHTAGGSAAHRIAQDVLRAGTDSLGDQASAEGIAPAADGEHAGAAPGAEKGAADAAAKGPHGLGSAKPGDESNGAVDQRVAAAASDPRLTLTQPAADAAGAAAARAAGTGTVGEISGVSASASGAAKTAPTGRSDTPLTGVSRDQLGVEIAAQAQSGRSRFDIRLDPPELGHVHVRLDVDRDGRVVSHLIVDRADTLDLLRRDASQLQRALQDAGLKADSQTMQFSLRDQNAGQQNQQQQQNAGRAAPASTTAADGSIRSDEAPIAYRRYLARSGGVDIRI